MSAAIVGAFEHPLRTAPEHTALRFIAESARGALADAGLTNSDVDGLCIAGDDVAAPFVAEYLNLAPTWVDSTSVGGSAFLAHVCHAVDAIEAGHARVVLVADGSVARSQSVAIGTSTLRGRGKSPLAVDDHEAFLTPYGVPLAAQYALVASRHMAMFGTTREQLAQIAVTARRHASLNPDALYRTPISIQDVIDSRPIATPLHKLDCCVISDGGGALIVAAEDVAKDCAKPPISVLGGATAVRHWEGGRRDLLDIAAATSGPLALSRAGVTLDDIDVCTLYDSFTITVLTTVEALGFCKLGDGGPFVSEVSLAFDGGGVPVNPDGGALSSSHPGRRGIFLLIEATRQLRGEASAQVENARVALCHGTGGYLGGRHTGVTVLLGRV